MASLASSSSSINFLVHVPVAFTGIGTKRRSSGKTSSIRVTRSCLAEASALLQAAHYTVCFPNYNSFSFDSWKVWSLLWKKRAREVGQSIWHDKEEKKSISWFFRLWWWLMLVVGGYVHKKWHGYWVGVWLCFWYGHTISGSPTSCWRFRRYSGCTHVSFISSILLVMVILPLPADFLFCFLFLLILSSIKKYPMIKNPAQS